MPLLGELLHYDAAFRETTLCKTEAIELLCRPHAVAFPTRLVAREIAVVAQEERQENDRSLPEWMMKAGQGFAIAFSNMKDAVEPMMTFEGAANVLKKLVAEKKSEFAALAFKLADDDLSEFGIDASIAETIKSDPVAIIYLT